MSEKRYFKIHSSKHVIGEKNDYISLFNYIDKQREPNDKELKTQPFVKNLSAEKNYLHKLILKSLNAYHSSFSTKTTIYQLLQNIEILYHKGLYDQAMKLTKKALDLAKENELFAQEICIKEIQIELLSKEFKYEQASEEIKNSELISKELHHFQSVQKITTDCYAKRLEIGMSRSEEDSKTLRKFVQENRKEKSTSNTKRAEMYRLGLELTYAYFISDFDEGLRLTKAMTELYESNPFLIEYSTIGYVSSLYNLHNALFTKGQLSEAEIVLQKLENSKDLYNIPTSNNIGARVYFYSTNIRLDQYLKLDQFEETKNVLAHSGKDFEKFKQYIGKPQLYEYYFLKAKACFVQGDFRQALRCTNEVLMDAKFQVRKDLLSVVRLLNLLIHYELNNDFTLDYLTKQTLSYLKKKERLFKLENELIRFMRNQYKIDSDSDRQSDLKQLKLKMSELKVDPYERTPFQLFDFEYWATAKIQRKHIYELSRLNIS